MYRLMKSLRSIARSNSKRNDYTKHEIVGRLELLQKYSTLKGHCYSRNRRRPYWSIEQMEIVKALQSGDRSRASSLLSQLRQEKCPLGTKDFVYILENCARIPDPLFIKETEKVMREEGVVLNQRCYTFIIRALCKGGLVDEAFNEINNLQDNHDFGLDLGMLNDLLGGCAQFQRERASECLDLMENQLVGKNEVTYAQLLKLAVPWENLPLVHEMWKECTKYCSPNILLLQKFIWSFSRLGDVGSAYDILQKMVYAAFRGDFVISKSSGGRFSISRIDIPMPLSCNLELKDSFQDTERTSKTSTSMDGENLETCANNNEHGAMIFPGKNDLEGAKPRTDRTFHDQAVATLLQLAFNALIHAYARISNCALAEQLFLQMQDLGIEPSANSYDGFIKAAVNERGYRAGLELLEIMRQKELKPKDSTLAFVASSCCKEFKLDLAETLLDQISIKDNVRPYNHFLHACDLLDKPERAVRTLAKMKEMNLLPDIRTYEILFSLFVKCNAPYEEGNMLLHVDVSKRIKAIEDDMVENNLLHSPTSLRNLLRSLGAEGMVSKLIQYLRMAETQLSRGYSCLETSTYNVVLHSLRNANEVHMAIEIFKSMKSNGFLPDDSTYDIMINCFRDIKCFRSACTLLSLMIRDGFYPLVVTYTNLIKILLGNGGIDEALKLMDQGLIEGIKFDVILYNSFFYKAREKGRIDVIELLVDHMLQNNVQPEPKTCCDVFSAYVDQGYMNMAMEALQVLSMRMISQEDSILQEYKMELEENYIFAEDSEAESRILELFTDYKEHLAVALFNLRWCATLGFPISWLPNQSLWCKRLSDNYATYTRGSSDSFAW